MKICNLWSTAGTKWKDADWSWADCQLVKEICLTWGNAGVFWRNANWKWSECSSSIQPPTPPAPVILTGVDATTLIQPWLEEPWNPYKAAEEQAKRKRLVELICKVKGIEYDAKKEIKNFNITVEDVKMVVKAVSNIDLNLKME